MGALPPPRSPTPWPPHRPVASVARDPGGVALAHLAGYEAVAFLGRGRYGAVFKARQTGLKRLVAIKVLDGLPGGPGEMLRFRLEAETLLRLEHENIVPILDVRESDGGQYLALEFCGGGSLEDRLGIGPLPQGEAVALIGRLARAVQAAHDKGIVHGELAASNVLWTEEGTPKLSGFGLARLMTGRESGPEADVEALGGLLRRCVRELPPGLEAICRRCESPEPARRYRCAGALADDLERFQAATRGPAARLDALARMLRPLRRRWFVLPVLVAAFLPLVGALAGQLHESGRASLVIDQSAADLWIGAGGGTLDDSRPIASSLVDRLRRHGGITATEACLVGEASWRRPGGGRVRVLVVGSELGPEGLGPLAALSGRVRAKLHAEGAIAVCADDLDRLGLPDTLDEPGLLAERPVHVVGHAPFPASPSAPLVFCSPATARALLRLSPKETTFVLARCEEPGSAAEAVRRADDSLQVHPREELSLALRLRWLATAPAVYTRVGLAIAGILLASLLLGRLLPREPGESHRLAWGRAALAVGLAAAAADGLVRAVLTWGSSGEAHLHPVLLLEGVTALLALALALLAGAYLRRPRAAAPAPFRGRPATRAR
jgi:hypothetical protein